MHPAEFGTLDFAIEDLSYVKFSVLESVET